MTLLTTRLKLTGQLGDRAFYDTARSHILTIPTGAAVRLQVGLFKQDGTVDSTTGLATISLEIYESRLDAALYLPAVATASFGALTAETWADGTAQHATLSLSSEQTHKLLTTGLKQCWAVIYGVDDDGERTDLAAGPVLLFRTNAGGTGPEGEIDPLYPTLAQLVALLAAKADLVDGLVPAEQLPAATTGAVVYDAVQSLTAPQKTQARANIGAVLGTDTQAYSAKLDALAALTWAANRLIYLTGTNTAAVAILTAAARTLLAADSAENQRFAIGLPAETLAMQTSQSLALAGVDPQVPVLTVTGAAFGANEASVSTMTFTQAMDNVTEACHLLTLGVTSVSAPISGSSVVRILSQDVEQFAFNFDGSPRIYSLRRAEWRAQLGLGTLATVSATLGYFATGTDAANLTGNVAVARIANALTAPGAIGGTTPGTAVFSSVNIGGVTASDTRLTADSLSLRVMTGTGASHRIVKCQGVWAGTSNDGSARAIDFHGYSSNLSFANNIRIIWESTGTITAAGDCGLGRSAAGVLEFNNGTPGNLRDATLRNLLAVGGIITVGTFTVGTLPVASTSLFGSAAVTNALAPTVGAIVATGGSARAVVRSNGTNWIVTEVL